jgi:hypothetical protein
MSTQTTTILVRNYFLWFLFVCNIVNNLFYFSVGKTLAIKYGCKYIETSPGINHNVDELLVGMLAQIELREEAAVKEATARATGQQSRKGSSKTPSLILFFRGDYSCVVLSVREKHIENQNSKRRCNRPHGEIPFCLRVDRRQGTKIQSYKLRIKRRYPPFAQK